MCLIDFNELEGQDCKERFESDKIALNTLSNLYALWCVLNTEFLTIFTTCLYWCRQACVTTSLSFDVVLQFYCGRVPLSQQVGKVTVLLIFCQPRADSRACQSPYPSLADLLTHWHSLLMLGNSHWLTSHLALLHTYHTIPSDWPSSGIS